MTVSALLLVHTAGAAVLQPETVAAWEDYVARAKSRMMERLKDPEPIGCQDLPSHAHCSDEIAAAPTDKHPMKGVPAGLIHDWTGVVFIPAAKIKDVLAVLRDYPRYSEFYSPYVIEARLLKRKDAEDRFSVMVRSKAVLGTLVLNGDYATVYEQAGSLRWAAVSESTRIQEIDDYGLPGEHRHEANEGKGYLWRVCTLSIFEQRDGGVYMRVQAMALSRDIPASLKWLAEPFVRRASRNTVITSLRQTREAVDRTRTAARTD